MSGKPRDTAAKWVDLARWMRRTRNGSRRAAKHLNPEPIHDLRVALRHCISIADGLMEFDPCPAWKQMRRSAKRLLKRLGALRDCQVLFERMGTLEFAGDELGQALKESLRQEEVRQKEEARKALHHFDRRQWRAWEKELAVRTSRMRWDPLALDYLALEQWERAHNLHRVAERSKSKVAYHRLRLGLKRFRYTVECFLPGLYREWRGDLKQLQDLLGEVHDLDMLWASASKLKPIARGTARANWRERLGLEQKQRLEKYASRTHGRNSLWLAWRARLPEGERVEEAVIARLAAWASLRTPDTARVGRNAQIALKLYDVLARRGFAVGLSTGRARSILHAAALLEEVGRFEGDRGYHKSTYRMIRKLPLPIGWEPAELQLTALVARYHRKSLPQRKHKQFRALPAALQRSACFLGGILRLAKCLAEAPAGQIQNLDLEFTAEAMVLRLCGWDGEEPLESRLANAKRLLEIACRRPILIVPGNLAALVGEARAKAKAATFAA